MPVTEKPEPDFEMNRPVFHRPATEADIERPAAPPVATTLPEVPAREADATDQEPARRRGVRGSALPERKREPAAESVESVPARVVESAAEPEPVAPAPVEDLTPVMAEESPETVPVSQPVAPVPEAVLEEPAEAASEQLAMYVPPAPPVEPPSAKAATGRLKVVSKGRLPQMPHAFYNGTEGWVRLEFSLDSSGKPIDIHVLESRPKRVFNRVAMKYLRTWRYQVDGLPEAALNQRRNVKVVFKH